MQEVRSSAQEAAEDIFFGQVVIIWARWFVILAGTILILWSASSVSALTIMTLLLVPLLAVNFFVHGRYLMEKPINQLLLMGLSLFDTVIVTAIVLFWRGQSGLESQFFVFYYPLILAFAFVFTPRLTVVYTFVNLLLYTGACLVSDMTFILSSQELEQMAIRLITLGAMGGLATYYWRIQRERRRMLPSFEPGQSLLRS